MLTRILGVALSFVFGEEEEIVVGSCCAGLSKAKTVLSEMNSLGFAVLLLLLMSGVM